MRIIKMNAVESSQISSVGFDEDINELFVEFTAYGQKTPKKVYKYIDVPINLFVNLTNSDSIGSYFFHNIKSEFEYELLREVVEDGTLTLEY